MSVNHVIKWFKQNGWRVNSIGLWTCPEGNYGLSEDLVLTQPDYCAQRIARWAIEVGKLPRGTKQVKLGNIKWQNKKQPRGCAERNSAHTV